MSKKLVAYFSAEGTTAAIAQKLAQAANADLYQIEPEIAYTKADLDWRDDHARSTIEMKDPASRPAMSGTDAHVADYDVIFVGFPIWWYIAPTIVNTFLEKYDFSGKTIVLFATSGGSGFGKTLDGLKGSVDPSAKMIEGKLLNGNPSVDDLKKWAESLGDMIPLK